jgi:hypothetical protein
LADRIHTPERTGSPPSARFVQMSTSVLLFAAGCGAAALLFRYFAMRCFLVPPLFAGLQLVVSLMTRSQPRVSGEV